MSNKRARNGLRRIASSRTPLVVAVVAFSTGAGLDRLQSEVEPGAKRMPRAAVCAEIGKPLVLEEVEMDPPSTVLKTLQRFPQTFQNPRRGVWKLNRNEGGVQPNASPVTANVMVAANT